MRKKRMAFFLVIFIVIQITGCSKTTLSTKKNDSVDNSSNASTSDPSSSASDAPTSELLSERLGIPEHYQAEYTSESGISVITVDADIIVPEVSSLSVYEALPRPLSDEEIQGFLDRHLEDIIWTDIETQAEYTGYGLAKKPMPGYDQYSLSIFNKDLFYTGGDYYHISLSYGLDSSGDLAWMPPSIQYEKSRYNISGEQECLPLENGQAAGCSISMEEALAFARKEVHALAPDYELTNYGQIPVRELPQNPQYYIFCFTRHIDGVPVNDCIYNGQLNNTYGYTSGLGSITVIVRDEGVCALTYENPYDLGRLVEAEVSLLPFESILEILENVGMLSIKHLELYEELEENIRAVYQIKLGYMAVRQSEDIGAYYYLPVWDFYATSTLFGGGGYAHGKDSPPILGSSFLTINAIDGTILDRNEGY